jgi:hypothetical protein
MNKKKWPISQYHWNTPENPCCCFQVTRRIHFKGETNYKKETVFLSKENNTLAYYCFESANYTFWDECIAVWKIKSLKSAGAAKEL